MFYRKPDDIEVIYVSDIAIEGSQPVNALWRFDILQENIESGMINVLRFNLLDIEVEGNINEASFKL